MPLQLDSGLAVLVEPLARVDGEERTCSTAQVRRRGLGLEAVWSDGLRLGLEVRRRGSDYRLLPWLTATRRCAVDAVGVRVRARGATRILVDGYHSWDWAGVRDATCPGSGWWGAVWGTPSAPWLGIGVALDEPPSLGALHLTWDGGDRLDALSVGTPHHEALRTGAPRPLGLRFDAGDTFRGDPLRLVALRSEAPGGAGLPRLRRGQHRPRRRQVGWMSWNCLGPEVCAADVVEAAATLVPDNGVVLLDDGWARAWGDWEERDDFDACLADLAATLAAMGRILGLWLAPFLVAPTSRAAADLGPLLLRDDDGQLVGDPRSPVPHYVLDASLAATQDHLAHLGERLGRLGIGVLKLDFLHAGALGGRRRGGGSDVAALRAGVQALADAFRAAAGPGAAVWASGAPAPPLVGLVDACRSGGDAVVNVPAASAPPPPQPWFAHGETILRAQERNLAARAWLWGGTVPPDVDAVTLGPVGFVAPPEPAHARAWLRLAMRAGGPLLDADEPTAALVPAEVLDDLRRAQSLVAGRRPVPARPADPLRLRPTPAAEDHFYSWPADLPTTWLDDPA